ncbi:MAG: autotransporter domain-containing protein [Alphaproteobacteria bacterium]|nr:autotransporter domain-containing protein [Alphaproteobacteria bacterium]MBL7097679.1 autotransporter domain-containing protein [Alphaproteobacteria bacterium]
MSHIISRALSRPLKSVLFASASVAVLALSVPAYAQSQLFVAAGPGVEIGPSAIMNGADLPAPGQPTNVQPQFATQSGAIQALAFDPSNSAILLAASPNGGIFRSTNGGASWTATTDNQGSLSIASLSFDPTDATGNTVIAGVGLTSSGAVNGFNPFFNQSRGGVLDGLIISNDAGATWTNLNANLPTTVGIQGVAVRGSVVLAAAFNEEGSWQRGAGVEAGSGLYRSTDGGHTFSAVSGLPAGAASALVGDPTNPNRMYVAVTTAAAGNSNDAGTSVWTTTDGGATWSKVFDATNSAGTISAASPTMLRLAAGPSGSVAVAVVNGPSGTVTGLFLSKNNGTTWNNLSIALTPGSANGTGVQDGSGFGSIVNPDGQKTLDAYFQNTGLDDGPSNLAVNPGGQASIHSVISIDPTNPNIVYLAGDRQDLPSITGAVTYSGNALSAQLNADNTVTYAAITDNFTADLSTYHPDTRAMAFTPSGTLIVGSDGGVYSRTSPSTSTGVWRGLNTGRQALEIYDLSLDPHSGLLAVAAQDNGTAIQDPTTHSIYRQVAGGDGTVAPVNGKTDPNSSWTYVACQYLCGGPTRVQTDLQGNFTSATPVDVYYSVNGLASGIIGIGSSNVIFVPKLKLNNIDPTYQALGVQPGIIVAHDNVMTPGIQYSAAPLFGYSGPGAYTILKLTYAGPTGFNGALDFGTRDNEWALLAGGSSKGGHRLYVSTATSYAAIAGSLTPVLSYTGFATTAVLFDPRSQSRFFATDNSILYGTVDGGATGTNLASNLPAHFIRPQSLAFISTNGVNELLVGGLNDTANVGSPLVIADSDASGVLSNWRRFGLGLPNADVTVLDYEASLDELAIGTFGRGVFQMFDVTSNFANATVLQFGLANNDSTPDTAVLTDGTVGTRPLIKYGTGTLTITGAATYTGGTTINGGTLQLGTGGSIIGNVAFCASGAQCDTSTNKFLTFNRTDNFTFAGAITGPGQVTQIGTGTTVLTGASTYTGPTLVSAGTLKVNGSITSAVTVNAGATLTGSGSFGGGTINGTLSAGDPVGTLTSTGSVVLGAGSTTAIIFSRTSANLLAVTGSVTLGGTAQLNELDVGHYGDSHVFITTTGGITGTFATVANTMPGVLFPVVSQVGNNEVVSIGAGSFVTLLNGAGTPDQLTIAAALDADRGAHYNDLAGLYQAIDPLTGSALGQALTNLAPKGLRTAPLVGDMQANTVDNMITQHMGGLGPNGTQTAGLSVDGDGIKQALNSASPPSFQSKQLMSFGQGIATNPGGGNAAIPTTGTAAGAAASPQAAEGMWLPDGASGFLSGSALQGSVAVGGGGGRADVRGLVIGGGLDMPVGDGFTVGAALAYSDTSAVLRSSPNSLQSDSIQGGLYARYDWGSNWSAEAFGVYGHQTMTTRRMVVIGPTTFNLVGHTGGDTPTIGAYVGRSFRLDTINGSPITLTPNLSLTYLSSEVDPFTETGGAPAMTFAGFSESSLTSRLALDASMPFDLGGIRLIPNVHLAWADSFEGNNGSIQAAFAAAPASIMTFAMIARERSYGEMGLGLDADLGDFLGTQATLSGRYDGNTRSDVQYGAWTGRLTIRW